MALLDFLLIFHSGKPDAFARRHSLRTATLASIIALTAIFLVYLWISVPPALVGVVWVACGMTLLSSVGMAFMCKSHQESALDEKPKQVDGASLERDSLSMDDMNLQGRILCVCVCLCWLV
ncbi:hypothetical protein AMTRI_Chr05g74190 [Amborella trichopoda]